MIKMEEDVGEGRGEEAGTGRALRRRLDEGGAAVQDETRLLRAHAEAQALAIQGMEQTRVIGEQLVQAKSRIAELTAEMKIKDAVMQEKERLFRELIQSKDVALQEKESHFGELINSKDVALQCKDELLQSKDAEIRRLQADLARLSSEVAAGGAALHPAPARAAAAADAVATAESPFQEGLKFANGEGVAQDDAEAVRLYRLAAAQGHARAQFNLGLMFMNGRGVAKDDAEAVRLYRLAAAQGNTNATAALNRLRA